MKKVGISDVARASGVSNATASYALNGKTRVAESTRLRVLGAANELGYIPNNSAVRLRTGRSNLLGAIINDITNPFFAEMMAEFEDTAWKNGFLSIVATSQDDPERQSHLIRSMLAQGVAGLIVSPVHGSEARDFKPLFDNPLPFVICVRDIEEVDHEFIGVDDFQAGQIAGQHIFGLGHRKVAFVGGYEHTTTWRLRIEGLRAAAKDMALENVSIRPLPGGEGTEFGRQVVADLLERRDDTTVIVGLNDDTAIGAYLAAASIGQRVGQDFSVIGFDNIPQSSFLVPALTTVELFPRTLGQTLAKRLAQLMTNPASGPKHQRLEPKLIARGSVVAV